MSVRVLSCSYVGLYSLVWFFFFQAEDGIRDLVRSRGLGDVYKRQVGWLVPDDPVWFGFMALGPLLASAFLPARWVAVPVSYTHLTLPTSDLV